MTCIKITESQNGQIYPEDTFSHGAAHMFSANIFNDHHMSSTIQIMSCQSIQKIISKFFIFADNNSPNRE